MCACIVIIICSDTSLAVFDLSCDIQSMLRKLVLLFRIFDVHVSSLHVVDTEVFVLVTALLERVSENSVRTYITPDSTVTQSK